jgi:hypothetical protein
MKCSLCDNHFDSETQSAACPHGMFVPHTPLPGGVRLRADFKRQIEDAFQLRDKETLYVWLNHLSFAARAYAQHMLDRLEETEKNEYEATLSQLEE